jgi:hypothetical protein
MKARPAFFQLGFLALCLASLNVSAHALAISTLTLVPDEGYLHLDLTLNAVDLTFFSELDANRDGRLDPAEWTAQGEKIAGRILEHLKVCVNDRSIAPEIAGLSQSCGSQQIAVRAHFPVDARKAAVSLQSQLSQLTSVSHVTQVKFRRGNREQVARFDMQSDKVTFDSLDAPKAVGALASAVGRVEGSPAAAIQANDTAVTALLGLIALAAVPPIFFCALIRRNNRGAKSGLDGKDDQAAGSYLPAPAGTH